ncbi:MAG: hypothetical protein J6W58_06000 [Lachnospiraceae bacterium]|nr:hypothetical protein [Lachnospiraceae bacterium]
MIVLDIGIHPGKIEIYNPGSFPDDLTPLDFISRKLPSYKRNKLILDICFEVKTWRNLAPDSSVLMIFARNRM